MNSQFKNYLCFTKPISKNKTLEILANRHFYYLFVLNISSGDNGGDHTGPIFEITLFGYSLEMSIRDNRHWDEETETWCE